MAIRASAIVCYQQLTICLPGCCSCSGCRLPRLPTYLLSSICRVVVETAAIPAFAACLQLFFTLHIFQILVGSKDCTMAYHTDLKWRIIYLHMEGFSAKDIESLLRIGKTTVYNVLKLYKRWCCVKDPFKGKSGRRKLFSGKDLKVFMYMVGAFIE